MTPRPVPPPRSHDDEVDAACRYERGLAVKALIALAIVAVLIVARILWL
ncbi:MAG TPA: hypothetical protein VIZ00_02160 [Streptosporangiaceae bacterium]